MNTRRETIVARIVIRLTPSVEALLTGDGVGDGDGVGVVTCGAVALVAAAVTPVDPAAVRAELTLVESVESAVVAAAPPAESVVA